MAAPCMPALYPPWSNAVLRIVASLGAIGILGVPVGLMVFMRTPYVTEQDQPLEQPVMFDHRHHASDDGIDCQYCHATADRARSAGMPSTETCMGCHGQIWTDSPLLEPVRRSWADKTPIVWRRVHRLPDFVRFDHGSHVAVGVLCKDCHGEVERMAEVRVVSPLQMRWCIGCHRDPQGTTGRALPKPRTDCTVCHM